MALSEENGIGTTMLVSPSGNSMPYPYPVYGGGGNGGNGFGDGNGWWIILLFILLASGNWGGNNGGFTSPYVINDSGSVQRGFDQAAIMGGINALTSNVCNGFADVQQSLCNGFAGVNATINGGFANAETAANARAMASMQQMFGLQTQFADCCCENRLASANLANVIQRENCDDRYALAQSTRDIIESGNRNNQAILDKLCALELDAKNTRISELERQLTMSNLAASQTAQTARILADNAAQTVALEQYLNPTPIPAYMVQNPNCCNTNACGCGSF